MTWSPSTTVPVSSTRMRPIGVAVERDADVGAHALDLGGHLLGVQRATAFVDVAPVRLDAQGDDLRAQLLEHARRDLISSAVRAVDDDLDAVEGELLGEGVLEELHVAPARVLDAHGLADGARLGAATAAAGRDVGDAALEIGLDLVGSLKPSAAKILMPLS
jgi:hypothetical protein